MLRAQVLDLGFRVPGLGDRNTTYLQGECSYRRAEEVDEIQHRSSACTEYLPCRCVDVKVEVLELELSGLDAREVEDVVDDAQQQVRRRRPYMPPLFGLT